MLTGSLRLSHLVALGSVLAITACSQSSPSGSLPVVPSGLSVIRQAELNSFELCKDYAGGSGPAVTFNVGVDGDSNGSIDSTSQVVLSAGQCREFTGDAANGRDTFTVTEQVPSGYTPTYVKTTITSNLGSTSVGPISSATASGEAGGDVGTIVVFTNTLNEGETGSGRFTGGGNQITVGGARISRGLTLHCDLLLSNNLEVNWKGNQFHMAEHLTTLACTDDPNITQAPPAAPLDTMVGVGTGRYNGVAGFTIEFTLVDYGEPGGNDRAALRIFEAANPSNVVLDVPLQVLSNGNLQAHVDQPHK